MFIFAKIAPVIVLFSASIWRLYTWDYFETITPFSSVNHCTRIQDFPEFFAEDIEIDRHNGIAYFSVNDYRNISQPIPFMKDGFISKYDIKARTHKVMKLVAPQNFTFNPHGISLFRDGNTDKLHMVVITHKNDRKDYVEIFLVDEVNDELIHQKTLHSELFSAANSILAVSPNEFYITNMLGSQLGTYSVMIEAVLDRPWSNILLCNATSCKIAADNLVSANGLGLSHDGSTLFVGHTFSKQFSVFRRDPTTNDLTHLETVSLPMTADNLDVDEFNQVWIAGSTVAGIIESTEHKPGNIPSKVQVATYPPLQFKKILEDDGSLIRLATTAAQWNGNLLMSSIDCPFAVHCQI